METILNHDFLENYIRREQKSSNVSINNFSVIGNIRIEYTRTITNEEIIISNCIFKDEFEIFKYGAGNLRLIFRDCFFEKSLTINNSKFKRLSIENCSFNHSLDLSRNGYTEYIYIGKISTPTIIEKYSDAENYQICNSENLGLLNITSTNIRNLTIDNIKNTEKVEIIDLEGKDKFINNIKINNFIPSKNGISINCANRIDTIQFVGDIKGVIDIDSSNVGILEFLNVLSEIINANDKLIVSNSIIDKIEVTSLENKLSNINKFPLSIELLENNKIKKVNINGKTKTNNIYFESINLKLSSQDKNVINLSNLDLGKLSLTGKNPTKESIINFSNLKINKTLITDFNNTFDFSINELSSLPNKSEFKTVSTNLGKLKIFNSDLKSFNKTILINSISSDLTLINVILPEKIYASENESPQTFNSKSETNEAGRMFYRKERENYRQIKQALKAHGNTIDTIKFEAKEHDAYSKELKHPEDGIRNKINNFFDYIILYSIKFSNGHGQSWSRALIGGIICTLLVYSMMIFVGTEEISFRNNYRRGDLCRFAVLLKDNIHIYFEMLNPTHKLTEIIPYNNDTENPGYILETRVDKLYSYTITKNNSVSIVNILFRLVGYYFTFQMIAAFRKYTKGKD